jgi:hypothetical protein
MIDTYLFEQPETAITRYARGYEGGDEGADSRNYGWR